VFHQALGLVVTVLTLAVAVAIAVVFKTGFGGYQMVSDTCGPSSRDPLVARRRRHLALPAAHDRRPLPLTLLGAPAKRDPRSFVAWCSCSRRLHGQLRLARLVLFFLFFELTLVRPTPHRRLGFAAALCRIKFFIYTFTGSAFLLVGILAVAFIHQSQTGVLTFELPASSTPICPAPRGCCSSSLHRAFAVKAPSSLHTGRPMPTPRPHHRSVLLAR